MAFACAPRPSTSSSCRPERSIGRASGNRRRRRRDRRRRVLRALTGRGDFDSLRVPDTVDLAIHGWQCLACMTKTVHIDDRLLAEAKAACEARTDTDTIRLGLEALVRHA